LTRKVETIEEFLARGGQITKVPSVVPENNKNIVNSKTTIGHDMMSLGEGEFLFGKTSAKVSPMKKRVNDEDFSKMLESSGLPSNMIDSIKKAVKSER
jgi:hypothetical protein